MPIKFTFLIAVIFCFGIVTKTAKAADHLSACWKKQVNSLGNNYLEVSYHETLNKLEHSFQPWQQSNYFGNGTFWVNASGFVKSDTLKTGNRTYFSKYQFINNDFLYLDYGDKDLFPVTDDMLADQTFSNARYSPVTLINYFYREKIKKDAEADKEFEVYKSTINKTVVRLYIRRADDLLAKVTTLNADELFGDVLTTYNYTDYSNSGAAYYPKAITIEKINGKLKDEVQLSIIGVSTAAPALLVKPAGYAVKPKGEAKPVVTTEKYNDHIYFVDVKETDSRSLIVEFDNFLLVAEAPMNSENGELIIKEAKKIAPNKPIKYFMFGHYHPDYIGGIRSFIHQGAVILTVGSDIPYVTYLAEAKRSLQPDSLQLDPKPLKVEEIKDSKTISDGKFTMQVDFIGSKSTHTNDYLIYYFPTEKLLFEDDLVWINKDGPPKKATGRQTGLYNAIKELNLTVDMVIQSWPLTGYGVKSIIPFADLESAAKL